MSLQNLVVVRFVKKFLEICKSYKKILKLKLVWKKQADLFYLEYSYRVEMVTDSVLAAIIMRNGEPYSSYTSSYGFTPLGSFDISNEEKNLMLEDLKHGTQIDGFTFYYPIRRKNSYYPVSNSNHSFIASFLEDFHELIRELFGTS